MASSINLGYALWQDGSTINGQLGRVTDVAGMYTTVGTATNLQVKGGVLNSIGGLRVGAGTGMQVAVRAGFAIAPNSSSSLQGGYKVGTVVGQNLTVATSDPTNPRIDLVSIGVNDTGDSSGSGLLQITAGTPAPSPGVPALPANSVALATVLVPAGSSSVVSGNVTDVRVFTAPAGGVMAYSSPATADPGFPGLIGYDTSQDRFFHNNSASTTEQFKVLPWPPVHATNASNVTIPLGTLGIIKSATFTCDGATDVKMTFSYPGIFQATVGLTLISWEFFMDATGLQNYLTQTLQASASALAGIAYNGSTVSYITSSNTGDTPTAGTHTVNLKARYQDFSGGVGTAPIIQGSSTNIFFLRVEPVVR